MPGDPQFVWKGRAFATVGDVLNAVTGRASREEADEFMAAYGASNPAAWDNVGYVLGWVDDETAARLRDWCQVVHPVFGNKRPDPREAFAAGRRDRE